MRFRTPFATEKLEAYEASGCKKYIIRKTQEKQFVWYKLASGKYQEIVPVDGILKSEEFPGVHGDKDALLAENYHGAIDGLNSALDELAVNKHHERT